MSVVKAKTSKHKDGCPMAEAFYTEYLVEKVTWEHATSVVMSLRCPSCNQIIRKRRGRVVWEQTDTVVWEQTDA